LGAAAAALLLLAPVPARAQADTDPPNPLTLLRGLACSFPAAASATWTDEGAPAARTREQNMRLEVTAIDLEDGTAEVRATTGTVFVSAVLSGWSLYFVENAVGLLNVTTVFAQEASPGRFKAVHSRHGYLQMQVGNFISEPSVSQNYGDCAPVE
jgi:hypothetical protein